MVWAYGGVNGQRGTRDGDIGTEKVPISEWFQLRPEFTKDNALKCMCSKCPVQLESACVAGKNAAMVKAMEDGMEGMPAPSDIPGLYCSTGKPIRGKSARRLSEVG